VLADSGFAAVRGGDVVSYQALMPQANDLPEDCEITAEYRQVIPKIREGIGERIPECHALLNWSEAKIEYLGYDYKPQPERGCTNVVGHGDARYRVTTANKSVVISIEDVMEIGGAFYAFDVPQCTAEVPPPQEVSSPDPQRYTPSKTWMRSSS
jgi:hypothetical protein